MMCGSLNVWALHGVGEACRLLELSMGLRING